MTYISDRELEFHRRPFRAGFAEPDRPRRETHDDYKERLESGMERTTNEQDKETN